MMGEAGDPDHHARCSVTTESDPDFMVAGETRNYSFETITKAIQIVVEGARFILANADATGPNHEGPLPATGAIAVTDRSPGTQRSRSRFPKS